MADNSKGVLIAAVIAGGAFFAYKMLPSLTAAAKALPSTLTAARPVSQTIKMTPTGAVAQDGTSAIFSALAASLKGISDALKKGLPQAKGGGGGPGGGGITSSPNPNVYCSEMGLFTQEKSSYNMSAYTDPELAAADYQSAVPAFECGAPMCNELVAAGFPQALQDSSQPVDSYSSGTSGVMDLSGDTIVENLPCLVNVGAPDEYTALMPTPDAPTYSCCELANAGFYNMDQGVPNMSSDCQNYSQCYPVTAGQCLSNCQELANAGWYNTPDSSGGWACCGQTFPGCGGYGWV